MLRGSEELERPIDPRQLATRITTKSVEFIERHRNQPFFLLVSQTSPHKPLLPTEPFAGHSAAGAFGDVVEELDWGVGEILAALQRNGLTGSTIVLLTSDNGPFPQGSTAGWPGSKGDAWEGGFRVPLIVRWPGRVAPGSVTDAMAMNIDIMPTLMGVTGAKYSQRHVFDGKDLTDVLEGSDKSPHQWLYFFNNDRIAAVRTPDWRLMVSDYPPWRDSQPVRFRSGESPSPILHDMRMDPDAHYDMSRDYPDVVEQLQSALAQGRAELEALSVQPDSNQYGDAQP